MRRPASSSRRMHGSSMCTRIRAAGSVAGLASAIEVRYHLLPPFVTFRDELPVFFEWLQRCIAPRILAPHVAATGEQTIRERTMRLPLTSRAQSHLEVIRFAASNRLCVDLRYQESIRRIEPYSLRRTSNGTIVLHVHNRDKNVHRSDRVERIEGASVTDKSFSPRFAIELTSVGSANIAPAAGGADSAMGRSA